MNKLHYYLSVGFLLFSTLLGTTAIGPGKAQAHDPNNLISDGDFTDWQTMDADGIQWFLDTHGGSRLRNFREGGKTAAQIIFNAARASAVNPYAILATIQKEESLVESNTNFDYRVRWAMGYGVCDGCDSNDPALQRYAGFTNQVMNGTWQLKRNYSYWASTGDWRVGHTMIIDNTSVTFGSRATSALYRYTPHLHGNERFNEIYNVYKNCRPPATYSAKLLSQVPRANYTARPGQRIKMLVVMRNTGTAIWRKDGANAMRLGNTSPRDRGSIFTGGSNQRWPMLQSAARRNGVGTFMFWFNAPTQPGTYVEKFQPVMEGVEWFGPEITYTITVSGSPVVTKTKAVVAPSTVNTPATLSPVDKLRLIK